MFVSVWTSHAALLSLKGSEELTSHIAGASDILLFVMSVHFEHFSTITKQSFPLSLNYTMVSNINSTNDK